MRCSARLSGCAAGSGVSIASAPRGVTNWPVAGGGYLRIFPFLYTRLGVGRAVREGVPVITYFHPWELDPEQPRMAGRALSRFRHYTNLDRMAGRIRQLCGLVSFEPFEAVLGNPAWSDLAEWRP